MNEVLSSLWFTSTIISIVVMAGIAFYIWVNYAQAPSGSKGFFVCLVAYKSAVCFEQLCAYIGSYGVSGECFTEWGLVVRLVGRAVEITVTALIFRYFVTMRK